MAHRHRLFLETLLQTRLELPPPKRSVKGCFGPGGIMGRDTGPQDVYEALYCLKRSNTPETNRV